MRDFIQRVGKFFLELYLCDVLDLRSKRDNEISRLSRHLLKKFSGLAFPKIPPHGSFFGGAADNNSDAVFR